MEPVVLLVIYLLATGMEQHSEVKVIRAPSLEACEALAAKINTSPIPDNSGVAAVDAKCIVLKPKSTL